MLLNKKIQWKELFVSTLLKISDVFANEVQSWPVHLEAETRPDRRIPLLLKMRFNL
jgi:hypothetical protein